MADLDLEHGTASSPVEQAEVRTVSPENGRWAGYGHLMMARMKEMWREPEVIFWVFVFPLLLALGLGIAFRNKPAGVNRVAIVAGEGGARALELLQASPQKGPVRADVLPKAAAFNQFRLGKYDLVVIPKRMAALNFATIRGVPRASWPALW